MVPLMFSVFLPGSQTCLWHFFMLPPLKSVQYWYFRATTQWWWWHRVTVQTLCTLLTAVTRQHGFTDRLHLVKPVKSLFPLSLCLSVRVTLRTRRWHEDARSAGSTEADRQADGETDRQVSTSPPWAGARLGCWEQSGPERSGSSGGRYRRGGRRHGDPRMSLSSSTVTLS